MPIEATWDPTVDATCINYGLSCLLLGIVSILIDFVLLSMPISCVLKLQLSTHQRWVLIFIFAAGGRQEHNPLPHK